MNQKLVLCELLGELPYVAAGQWGDRSALIFKGQTWTYRHFEEEVQKLADSLVMAGVRSGDRVALWLPNCPELQFLLFAVIRIGAIAVPLNTRYKSMDLAYALRRSGSVLLVSCAHAGPVDLDRILAEALGEPAESENQQITFPAALSLRTIVMMGDSCIPGHTQWRSFRDSGHKAIPREIQATVCPTDAALMMFTSGTTGRPKGVLLNHAGLKLCHDRARIMGLSDTDVQLTFLPLFHIYAFGYSVLMSFMSGACQVLMEVFNGEQALRLIEQYRVSMMHGFDAHFADLLSAQSREPRNISSLRFGSFATGAESVRALAERVQTELYETASSYGLTEMWGGLTISPPGATMSQRCEASGLPQPGIVVRIVDVESGCVLPCNTMGEIQVRSYARMIGYHEDPEATVAVLDQDGWFRTGDAGYLREDGYLRYLARYKDMLKVGGENVAPAEIEELLCSVPGVQSAAVVGQRNERLQEVPVAFVVAQHDHHPSESQVIEFFRGKIANFKIPARVIFLDELPMTSTGKVQKELLRKRLESENALDGA